MSLCSVTASLESLLVSSEKAVATAEEALSQAKTVLEKVKLSLGRLLTTEDQSKADSSLPGKKKRRKRKPRGVERTADQDEDTVFNVESDEENVVFLSDPLAKIVDVDSGIIDQIDTESALNDAVGKVLHNALIIKRLPFLKHSADIHHSEKGDVHKIVFQSSEDLEFTGVDLSIANNPKKITLTVLRKSDRAKHFSTMLGQSFDISDIVNSFLLLKKPVSLQKNQRYMIRICFYGGTSYLGVGGLETVSTVLTDPPESVKLWFNFENDESGNPATNVEEGVISSLIFKRPHFLSHYEGAADQDEEDPIVSKVLGEEDQDDDEVDEVSGEPGKAKDYLITPQTLLDNFLEDPLGVLILDTRNYVDYEHNHISFSSISIPEHLLKPGISAATIGSSLKIQDRSTWDKRGDMDLLIICDWDSEDFIPGTAVSVLRDVLTRKDVGATRSSPFLLSGGFRRFLQTFPHIVTNPVGGDKQCLIS